MGVQEIAAAIPTIASGNEPNGDLLRTELIQGLVGFIAESTSIVTGVLQVDPVDADLGGVRQAYVYGSDAGVFVYDPLDSTTAQDLIFCIVLIGGKRYKRVGTPTISNVISRTVTTPPDPGDSPPGSRDYGDAYLFLTGSWAIEGGSANQIGIWSSMGGGSWQWIDPDYGPPLYIRDEDAYVHWAGGDGWVDGVGLGAYPDASIPPSAFIWDNRVQNQTTNAQPTTIAVGIAHIIGPSPTGTKWAGNAGKLSISEVTNDVTIYTPYVGQTVFDIALGIEVKWNGTAWASAGGATLEYKWTVQEDTGSTSISGASSYAYSSSVAPTTANHIADLQTITMTGVSGQLVELHYEAIVLTSGVLGAYTAGLKRETSGLIETDAIKWRAVYTDSNGVIRVNVTFIITLTDSIEHVYRVWIFAPTSGVFTSMMNRVFTAKRISQ